MMMVTKRFAQKKARAGSVRGQSQDTPEGPALLMLPGWRAAFGSRGHRPPGEEGGNSPQSLGDLSKPCDANCPDSQRLRAAPLFRFVHRHSCPLALLGAERVQWSFPASEAGDHPAISGPNDSPHRGTLGLSLLLYLAQRHPSTPRIRRRPRIPASRLRAAEARPAQGRRSGDSFRSG
jgi:hypothetical protein